ncbi:MAG: ABC transporter ATP-binding protein [Euryarchaeota archaeon]|nr:ABC transporter ATP-binding protein [Euryarchaeota archaeon]
MTLVVDAEDVWFFYAGVPALSGISFQAGRGEIFGLLGPNGAGKTTLLDILSGQRRPARGRVRILGLDCYLDARQLQKEIGLATHELRLNGHLTVREVITFYGILYGLPRHALRDRVRELLEEVGLETRERCMVSALSEGMKGRLNMALALVHDPPVLMLDEPADALDPRAKRQLWGVLDRLRAGGKTILLTTHDMDEAELLCDRVAILDRGKTAAVGTVEGLKSALRDTKVVEVRMECGPEVVDEYRAAIQELNVECLRGLVIFTPNPQLAVQRILEYGNLIDRARVVVRNPSLEDVFMKLTGRAFQPAESDQPDAEQFVNPRMGRTLFGIYRLLKPRLSHNERAEAEKSQ